MHRGFYRFTVFHTPCELQLFAGDKRATDEAAHLILKRAKTLESRYNFFDPDSYLNRTVNNHNGKAVQLDSEAAEVFSLVRTLSEKVDDRFDITLGTLKQCNDLESLDEVQRCREAKAPFCGAEHWQLAKKKLRVDNPHTRFDLGGVIKEYAVDEAVRIFKRLKIDAGLINFGGDLYAHGRHPDGRPFEVGIKDPSNPERHIATVLLENTALTTSAHYERSRELEGEQLSHILAPAGAVSTLLSATVVAPSALWCGIATTAMMADETVTPPEGEWLRVEASGKVAHSEGLLVKID